MEPSVVISSIIDLDRYPIDQPDGQAYQSLIANTNQKLVEDGCAVLRGFARNEILPSLVAEAERASPNAHFSSARTNAYFSQDDPTLDPEHPARRFYDRSNAFIPADNFGAGSLLRSVYEYTPFGTFIQEALGEAKFFRYADPLADVIVNMAGEGSGFPWHFDTNNYTVTLALQNSEYGGEFEYAPNIRSGGENFAEVAHVLDEKSDRVKTLNLVPGDLQIFKGRYSLHRVAPLSGRIPRYVAIFSWVEEPNMVGSPERTKQLYGKVLPIHLERAGVRADDFLD